MKLILTRHGKSVGNETHVHEGILDGALSELGKKQAKKLAKRLKNERIDAIYSSDLKRASDTAREIARYHSGIPLHFVEDLREIDVGDFTGKSYEETDWSNPPQNLETHEQARVRVRKFLGKIYRDHKEESILLVSHDFTNRAMLTALFNESNKDLRKYKFDNTSVSILEIKDRGEHIIQLMNCTKHLD